ncbi:MAG: hypothetical protein IJ206_09235 [Oscillospiraceae bacterium]|nr:hypothetical protein [Oscillospiraceae bacterium]
MMMDLTSGQVEALKSRLCWRMKRADNSGAAASLAEEIGATDTAKRFRSQEQEMDTYIRAARDMLYVFGYDFRGVCDEQGELSDIEIFRCR